MAGDKDSSAEAKKETMAKRPFKMKYKNTAFPFKGSPAKHAPYAAAHTKAEGAVRHDNTAEAHGKKTEDYYDGSRGKTIQSTGARRDTISKSYVKKK